MAELEIGRSLQLRRDAANAELATALANRDGAEHALALLALSWTNRLVRVAIPKSRYEQLLLPTQKKQLLGSQTVASSSKDTPAAASGPPATMYRAALVLGVIPMASNGTGGGGGGPAAASAVLSLEFGDAQDVLPVKLLSNEAIAEGEWHDYSAACVRHKRAPLPSGDTLTLVTMLAREKSAGGASAVVSAAHVHRSSAASLDAAGGADGASRCCAAASLSAPLTLAPVTDVVAAQTETLQALQTAMSGKDTQIQAVMHRKRVREAELEGERDALQAKNKDLGQQLAAAQKEKDKLKDNMQTVLKIAKDGKGLMTWMVKLLGLRMEASVEEILNAAKHRLQTSGA
jgi:hypothetical protein